MPHGDVQCGCSSQAAVRPRWQPCGRCRAVCHTRKQDIQGSSRVQVEGNDANVDGSKGAKHRTEDCSPTFVAIAEAYPELKADKSFRQLFDQLRETEDKIASARIEYNQVVMEQNTRINTFPDMIVARKFGFAEHSFFSASDDEKHVVSTTWQSGESSQVIASHAPGLLPTTKPAPATSSDEPPPFPPRTQKPVSGSAATGTRHPDEPPPFPPSTS